MNTFPSERCTVTELVETVRSLPYGRPSDRTVTGMVRERRGTCSTKHLFLANELAMRFPETQPEIIHRVYRLGRAEAEAMFGQTAAAAVPEEGLTDVHRYLTALIDGRRITIDATFPGSPWMAIRRFRSRAVMATTFAMEMILTGTSGC